MGCIVAALVPRRSLTRPRHPRLPLLFALTSRPTTSIPCPLQAAYDLASADVLSALSKLEAVLSENQFIVGDKLTEADVR